MVQVLSHNSRDLTGWRIGASGRVFSAGSWRHPNGVWSMQDEVEEEEASDILEDLSEDDGQALLSELEARKVRAGKHETLLRDEALRAQERSAVAQERIAQIMAKRTASQIPAAQKLAGRLNALPQGESIEVKCAGDRERTFTRNERGLAVVFFKQGGRVPWSLPCTEHEIAGLLAGTMKVTYWKRTNRANVGPV